MTAVTQVLLLLAASAASASSAAAPIDKYVIVSNARTGSIGYSKVPDSGPYPKPTILISQGLGHPQGIAVDQKRQLLFVADSDLNKVVSYGLTVAKDGTLKVDEQTPVMENTEARWVAADGSGNVYVTDEINNQILKVSARQIIEGDTRPEVIYTADTTEGAKGVVTKSISAPGGIATDNIYLYWSNKVNGDQVGSVVRALAQTPYNSSEAAPVEELTRSNAKAYGVCLAIDNVFFTDSDLNLFAMKRTATPRTGGVATVSNLLTNPRGCAWDGDSTVYVADRGTGAIYTVPGPMVELGQWDPAKVMTFEDVFGIAVFTSQPSAAFRSVGLMLPLAAAMAAALLR